MEQGQRVQLICCYYLLSYNRILPEYANSIEIVLSHCFVDNRFVKQCKETMEQGQRDQLICCYYLLSYIKLLPDYAHGCPFHPEKFTAPRPRYVILTRT